MGRRQKRSDSGRRVAETRASLPADPAVARRVLATVLWLFVFCLIFFSQVLPNSNPQLSRMDVWFLLPDIYADLISPSVPDEMTGWRYLPQRLDLMLTATVILSGAWGLGSLVLRFLRVPGIQHWSERNVFAFALGLSGLSLMTLCCGLMGVLSRPLFVGVICLGIVTELAFRMVNRRHPSDQSIVSPADRSGTAGKRSHHGKADENDPRQSGANWLVLAGGIAVFLFLMAMALGAMLPSTDFDVKEYHLQGPKEFFQAGQISFLPHNVYTSFPFLTEMLSLLAMVVRGDWYWGALAGKAVLMTFAPLTALALFAAGRRWFSPAIGLLAAFVYLTTPWVYRISIIAYAEGGLAFFLFVSLLAALITVERAGGQPFRRDSLLVGLLAGSAMACKYTGLDQVVVPIGAVLLLGAMKRGSFVESDVSNDDSSQESRIHAITRVLIPYAIGILIAVGPWLLKNTIETGSPVYPLAYSIFGGRDWDDAVNARWRAGHSPDTYALSDLQRKFHDVTIKSDWLSPLLFAFAPLAFLSSVGRRSTWLLWGYLIYLFFAWWLLTHRIDRFWVPLIPAASLLASAGISWSRHRVWRIVAGTFIALAVLFNLGFATTPLCGYNAYLTEIDEVRRRAETFPRGIAFLNQASLPHVTRVLCVGEAQVFDARFPLVYNTVFDESIFQEWCAEETQTRPVTGDRLTMKPADKIRRKLADERISHVLVSWQEIVRYRTTYQYADFVAPKRFRWLRERGILGDDILGRYGYVEWDGLSEDAKAEIERWAPELRREVDGKFAFIALQVFPVILQPSS
jgi:hypothetical protein